MTWKEKLGTILVSGTIMLVMLAALLGVTWAIANAAAPIEAKARVVSDDLAVAITLELHRDNINVQVAVTALDKTPDAWANATVYHQWLIESPSETDHFIDEQPNMDPGRYRIEVELIRVGVDKPFVVPAQEVLVLP